MTKQTVPCFSAIVFLLVGHFPFYGSLDLTLYKNILGLVFPTGFFQGQFTQKYQCLCVIFLVFLFVLPIIARFASPLLSCTEGLFPFPYADLSSLFPEPKIYIFPHIRSLSVVQDVYTLAAPLKLAYIRIYARKYKMKSGFHVTTKDL
jgi:hypothetical protein